MTDLDVRNIMIWIAAVTPPLALAIYAVMRAGQPADQPLPRRYARTVIILAAAGPANLLLCSSTTNGRPTPARDRFSATWRRRWFLSSPASPPDSLAGSGAVIDKNDSKLPNKHRACIAGNAPPWIAIKLWAHAITQAIGQG